MSLIGGKVIALGNYGCVFNPSLDCESVKSLDTKVSKVIEKKFLNYK